MSTIKLTLKIWRQPGPEVPGHFETYPAGPISSDISFLEMLDILNERLTLEGKEPVAFDTFFDHPAWAELSTTIGG